MRSSRASTNLDVLRMIIRHWSDAFKKRFGGSLPKNYLSFDLETTGFYKADLIVEIGHCIVQDGYAVHRASTFLDWTRHPNIDQRWLRNRLKDVKYAIEHDRDGNPSNKHYHITYDTLREQGIRPERALQFYCDLFKEVRNNNGFFLGQNLFSFDARVLDHHLREWIERSWTFKPNECFDVGAVEKASQLNELPQEGDTMKDYFVRVQRKSAPGVKWNIEHCFRKYQLEERYGLNEDNCHGAGFDSFVSHLIFEEFRKLSDE